MKLQIGSSYEEHKKAIEVFLRDIQENPPVADKEPVRFALASAVAIFNEYGEELLRVKDEAESAKRVVRSDFFTKTYHSPDFVASKSTRGKEVERFMEHDPLVIEYDSNLSKAWSRLRDFNNLIERVDHVLHSLK